jgi:hypothetical protein
MGRCHLNDVLRNSKLFQAFRRDAGQGVVIIRVAAVAILGSARREDTLIRTVFKPFRASANGVSLYPSLDHEDVCIHAMRYGQKWMNIQKREISGRLTNRGEKQLTAP